MYEIVKFDVNASRKIQQPWIRLEPRKYAWFSNWINPWILRVR